MLIRYVEESVNTPPAGMEGWRLFRIEYGDGLAEGRVWMPPLMRPADTAVSNAPLDVQTLAVAVVASLQSADTLGDVAYVADILCEIAGRPVPSGPTDNWESDDNWEASWPELEEDYSGPHLFDLV
jgi:hypothetical protein